jgi:hypothetical protein
MSTGPHIKITEQIRIAYYKHLGNILEMQKELGINDLKYLQKVVRKLEKSESYEVSILVAEKIAEFNTQGIRSRMVHHMAALRGFDNKEQVLVSTCCERPVSSDIVDGKSKYYCTKCKKSTDTIVITEDKVVESKRKILSDIREEYKLLNDYVLGMRRIGSEEDIQRLIVKMGIGKNITFEARKVQGLEVTEENKEVVKRIDDLSMHDKFKLLKAIEKRIVSGIKVSDAELKEKDGADEVS